MNKDLTAGKPEKVLWQFCLPLFGSIIFQQLYNIADSFVAGKFISDNALAAVGNSYEITLIFIAFAFGCNIGVLGHRGALLRGQAVRRPEDRRLYDPDRERRGLHPVLMLVGMLCSDSAAAAHPDAGGGAARTRSCTSTSTSAACPSCSSTMLRLAFSRPWATPRRRLSSSPARRLSNIAVDILFVTAFDMGVAGVAWATFLCQGVSCVLALVVVFRRFAKIPTSGEGRRLLVEPSRALRRHRRAEHPAAELHLRRQHHHPERHQQLRRRRHGGLFRRREAQQHGHHLADHTRQRHLQLHGAESRRGESMTASVPASARG